MKTHTALVIVTFMFLISFLSVYFFGIDAHSINIEHTEDGTELLRKDLSDEYFKIWGMCLVGCFIFILIFKSLSKDFPKPLLVGLLISNLFLPGSIVILSSQSYHSNDKFLLFDVALYYNFMLFTETLLLIFNLLCLAESISLKNEKK